MDLPPGIVKVFTRNSSKWHYPPFPELDFYQRNRLHTMFFKGTPTPDICYVQDLSSFNAIFSCVLIDAPCHEEIIKKALDLPIIERPHPLFLTHIRCMRGGFLPSGILVEAYGLDILVPFLGPHLIKDCITIIHSYLQKNCRCLEIYRLNLR